MKRITMSLKQLMPEMPRETVIDRTLIEFVKILPQTARQVGLLARSWKSATNRFRSGRPENSAIGLVHVRNHSQVLGIPLLAIGVS
jgi:hypothetical protein